MKLGGEFAGPKPVGGQIGLVPAWSRVQLLFACQAAKRWIRHTIYSEAEVVGGEVFRAPGWSAGLLHLHFSVARGVPVRVEEVENRMIKDDERNPRAAGRYVNRVSSAVWPANIRRVVATGKGAQRRRDWIMQRRWLVILADALSMRALLVLTTLLVVISSLLVAILGLHFWYICWYHSCSSC